KRLFIKLKGAVVWDCALNLTESDSGKVKRLLASYKQKGQFDLQPISTKYLYTFQPRIPDSLLTIVTDALNVESSLLQRELPARFYLKWNNGLSLEIQTDIEGRQKSFPKNIVFNFQLALQRFFGQKLMTLKMSTTDALTLYRVVRPCMPTLLIY
ncbi:hypothetical protein KKB28_04070, partial [bacterium]|nr:hypothetical protein [bacterium]